MDKILFDLADITVADWLATPFLAAALIALCRVDMREMRLPNRGTLSLLAIGLALAVWRQAGAVPWPELAGATVGFGTFWGIGAAFWRLKGRDGLGLGDAKLIAAGGAWVGLGLVPLVVLIGACSSLMFILLRNRSITEELPFGPGLSFGIFAGWVVRLMVP